MREILFRGKDMETGEWVYGNLIKQTVCRPKSGIVELYEISQCEHGFADETDFEPIYMSGFQSRVYPETVGQFTGVTDKNGTRIFEGDIVKYGDTYAVIEYDVECYDGYVVYGFAMCTKYGFVTSYDFEGANVIGNIHDNPELLEEGQDG